MKIGVIGSGYVGLVTAACFAEKGNHVVVMDVDEKKIKKISMGEVPFYEPGLEVIFEQALKQKNLIATTNLDEAVSTSDIVFIAVGTPEARDGSTDLSQVYDATNAIGKTIQGSTDYKIIVTKSTVPPGTTHNVERILLKYRAKDTFSVANNPEFLKEGTAIEDFKKPDRIVIGIDDERAKSTLLELYDPFVKTGHLVLVMDTQSSELTKYAANGMLALRIAYMNELAKLAEEIGANIDNVRKGIGTDTRIGPQFLFPGPGYGGSCFPKDVRSLVHLGRVKGTPISILETVDLSNSSQRYRLAELVKTHLVDLDNKTLAIWGLAFKKDTDDVRETSALYIIKTLLGYGAKIRAYDPNEMARRNFELAIGNEENITYHSDLYEVLDSASALLIVTDWDIFKSVDLDQVKTRLANPLIIDGRNLYNINRMAELGFDYISIGRPVVKRI